MSYKTKFQLKPSQGLEFEEDGVYFRITNFSDKKRLIEIEIKGGKRKNETKTNKKN